MKRTTDSDRGDRSPRTQRDPDRDGDSSRTKRGSVAALQQSVGNQAVKELHERGEVQAKLEVSRPDDLAEREAERVAADVLDKPEGPEVEASVLRQTTDTGGTAVDAGTEAEIESVTSGGSPLSQSAREFFEPRFGRDFSDVQVHTGPEADEAARSIDAEAFTYGSDVVFASNNYQPHTSRGRELLAHELTHVVQQTEPQVKSEPDDASDVTSGGEQRPTATTDQPVSRAVGTPSGTYVQRFWPFTGSESDSSEESSDEKSQQEQQQEKISPNDLSENVQRALLNAGYAGRGKIPKSLVEQAREIAKINRDLANDDNVVFYTVCNALVASAYPTKTDANSWVIKFEGAVDDETGYSGALSVSKDVVRMVLEEALGAPDKASIAIDAYNALHRSPKLQIVNQVKTGGPAGEKEREIVENWEHNVLNYVLLDTDEKQQMYRMGEQTIEAKHKERLDKKRELANALTEHGLGGGNTGPSAGRAR